MSRMNDVGGMQGFGPVDTAEDAEPFHTDWEARVFARAWTDPDFRAPAPGRRHVGDPAGGITPATAMPTD
jgi:hypothetical protein